MKKHKEPSQMLLELAQRLRDCGKTQMEIADASGVGQTIVSRVMRGLPCQMQNFERLAAYVQQIERSQRRSRRGRPRQALALPVIDQARPDASAPIAAWGSKK